MKTFNDMPYQKDDVKSIISHAMKELDRAGLMRDKAFYNSYTPSVARIYKRLNDSIDAYNAYYQSIIDAKAEFNKANSNVTEMLGDEWVIDWATFNYTLPCAVENTPVTAIVVHGTNYAVRRISPALSSSFIA
jgi:6-pyruvoyl-tetrahydropterin synthase